MKAPHWILALVTCLWPAAACGQDLDKYFLTGNDEAVWLVRSGEEAKTFKVVARPANKPWKWIDKGITGQPAVVTASGPRLYALLHGRAGYLTFDLRLNQTDGRAAQDAHWPADASPIAACSVQGIGPANRTSVIVAVSRRACDLPSATAPFTLAGDTEGFSPLAIFQNSSGDWAYLGEFVGEATWSAASRVFLAGHGGELFVLVCDPATETNHLAGWKDGKWRDVNLAGPLVGRAIAMLEVNSQVAVILAGPVRNDKQRALQVAWLAPTGGQFTVQAIQLNNNPMLCGASEIPLAGRLGADRIAILWAEDQALRFGAFGRDGKIISAEQLDIFSRPDHTGREEEILRHFILGVLAVIFITMFVFRPAELPKPFTIPAGMAPGRITKRLVAGIIDFIPFNILAVLLFPPPYETIGEAWEMLRSGDRPEQIAYLSIASLVSYVAYCIFMEKRFGATLGKRIFKLRVVGDAGRPPNWREVLLRNLVKIIEWSFPLLFLIPLFSRNRQRLGDMIAKTAVVDATAPPAPPAPPGNEP